MMQDAATSGRASWLQATARQRVAGLLDPNSFTEFLGPSERVQSPHLQLFDLPSAFDDGVVIGRGKLDRKDVLVAAQEGQFMGGTFAEVSGAKIVGLVRAARDHKDLPQTVLLLIDSGGVRLQEANAGELALKLLAKTTPVFAPGLDHLLQLGAVAEIWDPTKPLDEQLEETLRKASPVDTRDELGAERKGRPMAAKVAKRVIAEATGRGGDVAPALRAWTMARINSATDRNEQRRRGVRFRGQGAGMECRRRQEPSVDRRSGCFR